MNEKHALNSTTSVFSHGTPYLILEFVEVQERHLCTADVSTSCVESQSKHVFHT